MKLLKKAQFGLIVVAAILIPGLADYVLASAGYKTLAGLVWTGGYGFGVVAIWYLWVRPLDLTGPTGIQLTEDDADPGRNPPDGGAFVVAHANGEYIGLQYLPQRDLAAAKAIFNNVGRKIC